MQRMERELTAVDRNAERRQRTLSKTDPLTTPFKTPRLAQTEDRKTLVADKQDKARDQDQDEDEESQQETHQGVAWVTP
jgi:hypothetical protein